MASTLVLVAVVILAVEERPGRRFAGGIVERHHDLEILGLLAARGGLRGGRCRWSG